MKMDFSYLQTLRECAVQCYKDFAWYAPDTFIKHYEELQEAINSIDKDGLHEFFISLNVNNPDEYYFGIPNETKIRLEELQGFITNNRASISKIIPYIEDIDDFCTDFIPFLDKELQMLKEKTDIDPTDEDNYALGFLNRYSAERWISKFINRDEISIKTRARRLRLALATDGIDKEKQAKLQEALSQIEEQINETARIEQAAEHNACISTEPRTARAKQAFAKALELGFMTQTDNGYKWTFDNGSKVSLGYFICMVYNPDNSKVTPFKALEKLFDVSRLDRAVEQATNVKNPQGWRKPIDELLQSLDNNT